MCQLHNRFFEGAEPAELEDRVRLVGVLAQRVRAASTRLSLFAFIRETLAKFENELDWLSRLLVGRAPVDPSAGEGFRPS